MEKIYEFVASLNDFKPRIYRRFLISEKATIQELMDTLMAIFEMDGYHLYDITKRLKNVDELLYLDGYRFVIYPGRNSLSKLFDLSIDEKKALLANELERELEMEYSQTFLGDSTNNLSNLGLKIGESVTFNYDYGDDWQINVKLDKILDSDKKYKGYPYVKSGKGSGIIEDIGGTYGLFETVKNDLEDFMEFYKADANDFLESLFT